MSMNLQNEFQNTVPKIERYVSVSTLYKTKFVYSLYCMQRRDKAYAYIQNFLTIDQVRQPVILWKIKENKNLYACTCNIHLSYMHKFPVK